MESHFEKKELTFGKKVGAGFLLVPVFGIIAAVLLSFAYTYLTLYVPITGYLSLLFLAGLVIGVGLVLQFASIMTKSRHPLFLYLNGLIIGLFTLYIQWAVFFYVFINKFDEVKMKLDLFSIIKNPEAVMEFIKVLNETGWYTLFKSFTPKGFVLWAFWGIEALVIVGGVTLLSASFLSDKRFCDDCNEWTHDEENLMLKTELNDEQISSLKNGSVKELFELPVTDDVGDYPYLLVNLTSCKKCNNLYAYKLTYYEQEADEVLDTDISPFMKIDSSIFHKLLNMKENIPATTDNGNSENSDDSEKKSE